MTIKLLSVGKTDSKHLKSLTDEYTKRLGHFCKFTTTVIPDIKNSKKLEQNIQKIKEGELILKHLQSSDIVILLDENGKHFTSKGFAKFIQKQLNTGKKQLVFIIGGPYGFSEEVYQRATYKVALSQMTFSHQMVRLFFTEQLYRAFSILHNQPYHHD